MPVIREERRVGAVRPGGVVGGQAMDTFARAAANFAGQAMQVSETVARVMTQGDQDEAIALATQTAITLDDKGVPQVDRSAREKMTRDAKRAYDRTLQPRYRQRLAVAVDQKLDALALEFEGDPAGFKAAAAAAIEGMAETVPTDFQAFWQDAAAMSGAKYGAQLGQQAATQAKRAAASDYEVMATRAVETITSAILGGNEEAAEEALAELSVVGGDLVDQRTILPHMREAAIREANAAMGAAKIQRMGSTEGWTSADYEAAATALTLGGTEFDSLFPDAQSRAQASSKMRTLAADFRQQEIAAAKQAESGRDSLWVLNGMAEADGRYATPSGGTASGREMLDAQLGTRMEDWGTTGIAQDTAVWEQIQRSGFLPASLQGAFLAASRPGNMDSAAREQVFRIWRTLTEGRAPDGSRTNLADDIAPEITERFMLATAFMEFGGESFEQADLFAQEFQKQGFDKAQLAAQMGKIDTGWFFWSDMATPTGGGQWDPETIDTQIETWLDGELENRLDTVLRPQDTKLAAQWFKKLLATDRIEPNDALAMIETQFGNRYVETSYIYDLRDGVQTRSWAAPEKVYQISTDPSASFGGWLRERQALSLYGGMTMTDQEREEATRPWFDRWAEAEIRPKLSDRSALYLGSGPLQPGEDYRLEPIGDDRQRPRYRVYVANENGTWSLWSGGILDPAPAHEREVDKVRAKFGPSADEQQRIAIGKFAGAAAELARLPAEDQRRFHKYAADQGYTGLSVMSAWEDFKTKELGR